MDGSASAICLSLLSVCELGGGEMAFAAGCDSGFEGEVREILWGG